MGATWDGRGSKALAFRGSNHDLDLLARCTGRGAAGEREAEGVQRAPIQYKILEVGAECTDLAALGVLQLREFAVFRIFPFTSCCVWRLIC